MILLVNSKQVCKSQLTWTPKTEPAPHPEASEAGDGADALHD